MEVKRGGENMTELKWGEEMTGKEKMKKKR